MPRRNRPTKHQRMKRKQHTIYIKHCKKQALVEQAWLDEYGF